MIQIDFLLYVTLILMSPRSIKLRTNIETICGTGKFIYHNRQICNDIIIQIHFPNSESIHTMIINSVIWFK